MRPREGPDTDGFITRHRDAGRDQRDWLFQRWRVPDPWFAGMENEKLEISVTKHPTSTNIPGLADHRLVALSKLSPTLNIPRTRQTTLTLSRPPSVGRPQFFPCRGLACLGEGHIQRVVQNGRSDRFLLVAPGQQPGKRAPRATHLQPSTYGVLESCQRLRRTGEFIRLAFSGGAPATAPDR